MKDEPRVEITYYVKKRDALGMTYSVCYTPEEAIRAKRDANERYGKDSYVIVRETRTTQVLAL